MRGSRLVRLLLFLQARRRCTAAEVAEAVGASCGPCTATWTRWPPPASPCTARPRRAAATRWSRGTRPGSPGSEHADHARAELVQLEPEVEVLEPKELRRRIASAARAVAERYGAIRPAGSATAVRTGTSATVRTGTSSRRSAR